MKSLALALVLALLPAGIALADHDIGCGVGTNAMKGQKGLGPKLAGSCTNGLTFQSISITFGLVGCNGRNEVTTADAELRKFASGNFDRLLRDMANGEGETLAAFSLLLGVPEVDQGRFFAFAQGHFADLFPDASTTAAEMLESLDRLLTEGARVATHAGS